MRGFPNLCLMALAVLWVGALCPAADAGQTPPTRLAIHLDDGTRLQGTVDFQALNVITGPGDKIEVPLGKIRSIEFGGGDRGRAEILFQDGATTLYGTLELPALELETSLGRMSVPLNRIVRISKPQITGLVGYYPFNGNANDESGNGNNGTVHGAVLTVDRFGHPSGAYYFRGKEDYIDCGMGERLLIGGEDKSWTLAFWIWRTEPRAFHHVIGMGSAGANCAVNVGPTRQGGFAVDFGQNQLVTPQPYPDVKQWHHWAVTYDGRTNARRICRDGILVGHDVSPEDYLGSGPVYIGQRMGELSWELLPFHGAIDEVRVYDRALLESEVQELHSLDAVAPGQGETGEEPGSLSALDGRMFVPLPDRVREGIRSRKSTHRAGPGFAEFHV